MSFRLCSLLGEFIFATFEISDLLLILGFQLCDSIFSLAQFLVDAVDVLFVLAFRLVMLTPLFVELRLVLV